MLKPPFGPAVGNSISQLQCQGFGDVQIAVLHISGGEGKKKNLFIGICLPPLCRRLEFFNWLDDCETAIEQFDPYLKSE